MIRYLSFTEASGFLERTVTKRKNFSDDNEDVRTVSIQASPRRHTPKAPDYRWKENGALEYSQEHSWQGTVDLFNQYYNGRSHPPALSGNEALDLFKNYQQFHVQDINIPIDTEEQSRTKSKRKGISLNKKACHYSAEVQASHEFVQPPFSQGPYSPISPFQDNQPLTPEEERSNYEAYLHFLSHYGHVAPFPT